MQYEKYETVLISGNSLEKLPDTELKYNFKASHPEALFFNKLIIIS